MVNPTSILKALAGTYALINSTILYDGVPGPDPLLSKNFVGLLIYTATGYVSCVIAATENSTLAFTGPLRIDTEFPSNRNTGQIYYGPIVATDFPGLTGTSQHYEYNLTVSRGRTGFPRGTKVLTTISLRGGGVEELAVWRSID